MMAWLIDGVMRPAMSFTQTESLPIASNSSPNSIKVSTVWTGLVV